MKNSGYEINPKALYEFVEMIENSRIQKGLSKTQLAELANIHRMSIHRIISCEQENMAINTFLGLTEALSLTEEQIVYLYRLATYKDIKQVTADELQKSFVNKLDIELNTLRLLRDEINTMIEVKEEVQKVNKK